VAFGWSFPKLLVLITVLFLLFGVPLMAYIAAICERRRKESRDE
jgi:phage shock protein PspC (stress-responsive transcriptional regulator)